jgi:hypothetical protein
LRSRMPKEIPDFFDPDSWVLAAMALCGCKHCKTGFGKPCLINPVAYQKIVGQFTLRQFAAFAARGSTSPGVSSRAGYTKTKWPNETECGLNELKRSKGMKAEQSTQLIVVPAGRLPQGSLGSVPLELVKRLRKKPLAPPAETEETEISPTANSGESRALQAYQLLILFIDRSPGMGCRRNLCLHIKLRHKS